MSVIGRDLGIRSLGSIGCRAMGRWALLSPPRHPLPSDERISKPAEARFRYATLPATRSTDRQAVRVRRGAGRWLVVPALLAFGVVAGCAAPVASGGSADGGVAVAPTAVAGDHIDVVVSDIRGLGGPMTLVTFQSSVKAGNVTFTVKNVGTIDHEMVVLKTDTPFDKLPVDNAGDPPAPVRPEPTRSAKTPTSAKPATRTSSRATRASSSSRTWCREVRAGLQHRQALRPGHDRAVHGRAVSSAEPPSSASATSPSSPAPSTGSGDEHEATSDGFGPSRPASPSSSSASVPPSSAATASSPRRSA